MAFVIYTTSRTMAETDNRAEQWHGNRTYVTHIWTGPECEMSHIMHIDTL